jgi:hypothetical protein
MILLTVPSSQALFHGAQVSSGKAGTSRLQDFGDKIANHITLRRVPGAKIDFSRDLAVDDRAQFQPQGITAGFLHFFDRISLRIFVP